MNMKIPGVALAVALSVVVAYSAHKRAPKSIFAKDNLVAWCIVPFDSAQRGPVERAQMLKRLGITMLAYDWREKDIPTFDQEVDALNANGIKLQAIWLTSGPDPAADKGVSAVLDLIKRRKLKTELWFLYRPPAGFDALPQAEKVAQVAKVVKYLGAETKKLNCKVGVYNHGGWYGEPENELEIVKAVNMKNVGIVYNFHHGHMQMDSFPTFFPKLLPYLLAVNINGMKTDGPANNNPVIIPLGEGNRELDMLKLVRSSGFRGPIGILNHSTERDAEVGLKGNMDGLKNLAETMGDDAAFKSY